MDSNKQYDDSTKRAALIVAVTGSFITPFIGSSINVALPAIAESLVMDAVMLSWVATSYLLAAGVSLVPAGRIADIYGRKRVLAIGFFIFGTSAILSAVSFTPYMLIISRVFQGIGGGMIFSTSTAILVSVYPPQERGKVLGITVSSVYIGLSSGPFVGGVLTMHLTWRSLFGLNFILAIAVLGLIIWKLKGEWAEARGEKLDVAGAVIYGITLISIIYGLSLLPSLNSLWLILIGLAGLMFFVTWEIKAKYPVFEVSLFKANRVFAFSNAAALIHYAATFGVTFLLSLYLQYVKSFDPQVTGLILISQPIMMAAFSPFAGRISDKIEPRYIASTGMAITCGMLFLLSFIQEKTSVFFIIACLLTLGFGYALFSSPNMNAIMSSVEKRYLGIASGSAGTMRVLGQMFSMGIATLTLSVFIGRVQITDKHTGDLIQSIKYALIIFGVLCLIGMFASLVRGNIRENTAQPETMPKIKD